jgi:hypothetical protein
MIADNVTPYGKIIQAAGAIKAAASLLHELSGPGEKGNQTANVICTLDLAVESLERVANELPRIGQQPGGVKAVDNTRQQTTE